MTNRVKETKATSSTASRHKSMRWLGQLQLTDVRALSAGGHGEVYAANWVSVEGISQQVVLKLARGQNPTDVAISRQFLLQEARLTASFSHANIIAFKHYGLVEVDGDKVPCLILEHGGVPLSAVIQSHGGRLDPGLAAFVAVCVLSGLAYSHSRDVIHRDVKPHNVLISADGRVRLCDYGIAKAADPRNPSTVVTNLKGTPVYISPEAYKGEKLDGRADIWSVGVMLFEMVLGRKPWEDDKSEPNEMVRLRRLSDLVMEAPLPKLPEELVPKDLAEVITKMLMKNREDRYEDALQAMYALETVAVRLVGPWAAGRELGQHALAAADPIARWRRPSLEESTANVREDRKQEEHGDHARVAVARASETTASMLVPAELMDEPSSEVSRCSGQPNASSAQRPEVPTRRRARGTWLKYGVAAASVVAAAAAAGLSGGQSTAAGARDSAQPAPAPSLRLASAHALAAPRDGLVETPGPLPEAVHGVRRSDRQFQAAEGDLAPVAAVASGEAADAAPDASRPTRAARAAGDEVRSPGNENPLAQAWASSRSCSSRAGPSSRSTGSRR